MAANELEIKIIAQTAQAEQGISRLQSVVSQFGGGVKAATNNIAPLNTAIQNLSRTTSQVSPVAGKAQFALTNLSRVVSDAPFGFIAIQNNLEPLLQSFQGLSTASGGAGGALKALGATLAGPAGVLIGFSVLSSVTTALIQKYGSLGAAVDSLFTKYDALADANKKLREANNNAVASAQGEINTIKTLISVANDKSQSDKVRQSALDTLNQKYDEYLPKLSKENIDTDKVKSAVDRLTESLIKQAKVRGIQQLINKEFEKQAEIANKGPLEVLSTWQQIKAVISSGPSIVGAANPNLGINVLNAGIEEQNKQLAESNTRLATYEAQLKSLFESEGALPPVVQKQTKELQKQAQVYKELGNLQASIVSIQSGVDVNPFEVNIDPTKTISIADKIKAALIANAEAGRKAYIDSFNDISNSLTNTLAPAFQGLFTDIANGGQNAFQAFGQAIKQVIIRLIAAAATAAILSAIIGGITGGANFGGGASGFVGGFKNLFGQLSGFKFANGTNNFMGGLALVGENGPELVNLPRGASVTPNYATGGSGNIVVNGVLRGENIYLSNQSAGIRRGRLV